MAGDEVEIIDGWIEGRLAANAALVAFVAARIFDRYAPADALYPFAVYQHQSVRDVRGLGPNRIMVDGLYIVKAVAEQDSFDPLRGIANAIDAAMTVPEGGVVVGGMVFTSVREEPFRMVEIVDGRQVRHLGGIYRLHAQAA